MMIRDYFGFAGIWIGIAIVAGVLVYFGIQQDRSFEKHCNTMGGHTLTIGSTGVGIGSNGKTTTTYSSETLCLNKNGGILDSEN